MRMINTASAQNLEIIEIGKTIFSILREFLNVRDVIIIKIKYYIIV